MDGISRRQLAALLLALLLVWLVQSAVHAHPGCSSGSCQPSPAAKLDKPRLQGALPLTSQPPHNGRISKGAYHSFEVVYLPNETRVYIYGTTDRPAKAQNVQGEITMQVKGNPTLYRNPLRYLPPIPGSDEGDCLQAIIDVTQIRDGDMQVTVQLSNLPYSFAEPNAQFRQVFALTRRPQAENDFPITVGDQVHVAAHQAGSRGTTWNPQNARAEAVGAPCCADCNKEQGGSLQVVTPPDRTQRVAVAPPAIHAQQCMADDRAAVESQRFCPVMRQPLSGRGTPWKVLVDGQPVFVCCSDCITAVQSNPAIYLAEARRLRGW